MARVKCSQYAQILIPSVLVQVICSFSLLYLIYTLSNTLTSSTSVCDLCLFFLLGISLARNSISIVQLPLYVYQMLHFMIETTPSTGEGRPWTIRRVGNGQRQLAPAAFKHIEGERLRIYGMKQQYPVIIFPLGVGITFVSIREKTNKHKTGKSD